MLSHVSLGVSDLARAGAFYDRAFAPLGLVRSTPAKDQEIAYGRPGEAEFFLYPAKPGESIVGAGTHFALSAPSRAVVDAFGAAAAEAGAKLLRETGRPAHLPASYYGAFISDLDGHKIEVVFESP